MTFAYADPPYLGCAGKHYDKHHPEAWVYDEIAAHNALIDKLVIEYRDGWALSCTSGNLRELLPICPADVRVAAWVKPFASFKPGVNPAYAWEPVIFRGGRKRTREQPTVRDWVSASIAMRRGFPGAKPDAFAFWLFDLLGMDAGDDLVDLFPGSGAVTRAWETWRQQVRLA